MNVNNIRIENSSDGQTITNGTGDYGPDMRSVTFKNDGERSLAGFTLRGATLVIPPFPNKMERNQIQNPGR